MSFQQDRGSVDVSYPYTSSVTKMSAMFQGADAFNQNLSGWCVDSFDEEPIAFGLGAGLWVLPRPVWGTCP